MRLVIAHLVHESNSFSPVRTSWESFGPAGPHVGDDAHRAMVGTRTGIGGLIDVAVGAGAEIVVPLAAYALPSRPVDLDAFERFCSIILDSVAKGCDGVLLDLHGAMIVEDGLEDGDGELLARIRKHFPKMPVGVSLDLHANVTKQMISHCDVIAGYSTYPHVDMYETGVRAANTFIKFLRGEVNPIMTFQPIPILAQTLKMNTSEGAMKDFSQAARDAEKIPGVLCASSFGGFPMADIQDAGASVVVVTDGKPDLGIKICEEIANDVWEKRSDLIWSSEPLDISLERAKSCLQGPILLIDHADNCASGGTQDVMMILREAIDCGISSIAVGPIRDPQAVAQLIDAGVGAKITVEIGGKTNMPAINREGKPLTLTGIVKAITEGTYIIKGPQLTGVKALMGRSVAFESEHATLIVTERLQEPWDLGVFTSLGVDPFDFKYIMLKSRMYFRPVFAPIAKAIIYCDGDGVTSSNNEKFDYRNIRRPIYPLDLETTFVANPTSCKKGKLHGNV
jgi:microcystin degradation protein MlrC